MKKNMGTADRVVRTVIAVILGVLIVSGVIKGTLAIILGIIAIAFLVTSIFARCPGYVPFGISTRKRHKAR
ncbi:MAG: DUF2892 domain-containing protein [bacterium]